MVALGQLVVGGALLAGNKADETKLGAGALGGGDPLAQGGVFEVLDGFLVRLLGDNLSALVHHEVTLPEATAGFVGGSVEHAAHGADDRLRFAGFASDSPARGTAAARDTLGLAGGASAAGRLGGGGPASGSATARDPAAWGFRGGGTASSPAAGNPAARRFGGGRGTAGRTTATGDTSGTATDSHVCWSRS